MSTSVDEHIENMQAAVRAAKLIRRKYPDANVCREGGRLVFTTGRVVPNRMIDVGHANGSQIVAYEEIGEGDERAMVQSYSARHLPVWCVLERLREKHPEAYESVVRWVGGVER